MHTDENEFFRQVTLRICSSLNIELSMSRCLEYLKEFIPLTGIGMGIYEADLNIIRIIAWVAPDDQARPATVIPVPDDVWDWLRSEWAKEPEVAIVNDLDRAAPYRQKIMSLIWERNTSLLLMDLELEEERIGGLSLWAKGKNRFTEKHAKMISLLHEPFAIAMSNILKHLEVIRLKDMLADDNRFLHQQLLHLSGDQIIGADFGLKGVMEMVRQVAPLDSPVLLLGETGVGKEVVANALHYSSSRKEGPFIKLNCGAIPESLIDSELFGHEKGAFTGAVAQKRGRFERAHKGSIFLDEIGELPVQAQVRLLRVIQNKEIERVGGTSAIPVSVRIISATHRNLEEMIRSGAFREDLWFRLNVFPIMIPPLRQRKEDIPALLHYFIEKKSKELKIQNQPELATGAVDRLKSRQWPGNVRELENLVERALIRSQGKDAKGKLLFQQLSISSGQAQDEFLPDHEAGILTLDDAVSLHIQRALKLSEGKVEGTDGAARRLGVHPSTLRGKMRKLGVAYGKS